VADVDGDGKDEVYVGYTLTDHDGKVPVWPPPRGRIERIAVELAIRHERHRGWEVESVESENRGFDLISRRPHPEDPKTSVDVRFIEVTGRAGVGVVALSENEYRTAERLKNDYWLYAVFNCTGPPELHTIQDPARLGWQPVVTVEHYQVGPNTIREADSDA
jgi:hypothetical protein